ncbi:MAG: hypothetical protein ACTSRI_09175 [Promethearchaeota archaeon]
MSKFDKYKKKAEPYIYPHKHCQKCGQMINEGFSYCNECYKQIKRKKEKKKRFGLKRKTKQKEKNET